MDAGGEAILEGRVPAIFDVMRLLAEAKEPAIVVGRGVTSRGYAIQTMGPVMSLVGAPA